MEIKSNIWKNLISLKLALPLVCSIIWASCTGQETPMEEMNDQPVPKIQKSEEDWRKELSPTQYHILREKGTEPAFSGKYYKHNEDGTYSCGACGFTLFSSDAKFHSGCGWPSYSEPLTSDKVIKRFDTSHGMVRTEILCANCGSHLGHVFDDGPKPTGLRYCINSAALDFSNTSEKTEK